jgi:hypothetical protein
MNRSEAFAFVATLQAAFPAGNAGAETAHLYATMLERHDADTVRKAIHSLIEERRDPFLPTLAEVSDSIRSHKPKPKELEEAPGVPMPPETYAAIQAMFSSGEARGRELEQGSKA